MASANKNNAVVERWKQTLTRQPDRPALFSSDGATLRTFSGIESEANSLQQLLEMFAPGSVLAIQIGNHASWPALLIAAFRHRLIPLPLGQHIGSAEREAVFTACGVAASAEIRNGVVTLSAVRNPQSAIGCDFLKLTSGTTAAPRAIRFSAGQLVADCDNICATMGLRADDVNFGVIPFSHSYGFSNLLLPLLCRGIALVASEERMPRAILHDLARSGATVFPGMPVFFEKLAELENVPELPRLRLCISAGAPLPRLVAERFTQKLALKIHTFYGSSECGGIAYDADDGLDYEDGFAGQPMENVRIHPLDGAGISRIEVRSKAVGDSYFPVPDPESLGEGRFVPADLVRISPRGLHLAGRASDVINVAGRKLNPAEVESRLAQFPQVKQVVVFGVPSALRHEEAVACVAGPSNAAEVLRFARTVLSGWQVPKDVWIVPEIPVNERGKISRRDLARQYAARGSH